MKVDHRQQGYVHIGVCVVCTLLALILFREADQGATHAGADRVVGWVLGGVAFANAVIAVRHFTRGGKRASSGE